MCEAVLACAPRARADAHCNPSSGLGLTRVPRLTCFRNLGCTRECKPRSTATYSNVAGIGNVAFFGGWMSSDFAKMLASACGVVGSSRVPP